MNLKEIIAFKYKFIILYKFYIVILFNNNICNIINLRRKSVENNIISYIIIVFINIIILYF